MPRADYDTAVKCSFVERSTLVGAGVLDRVKLSINIEEGYFISIHVTLTGFPG